MSQSTVGGLTPAAQELVEALASFRLLPLRIRLRARETMRLPPYKGSTIRGAFGSVFRRIACSLPRLECHECLLRETCPYPYIFETFGKEDDAALLRGYDSVPRPFVIDPPQEERTHYQAGESIEFGLTLIGRAIEYLPYFVVAFKELGEAGMGARRGRFTLEEIRAPHCSGGAVYSAADNTVRSPSSVLAPELIVGRMTELAPSNDALLEVEFLTSVRLQYERRVVGRPEFHVLIRQLLRRVSALLSYHHAVQLRVDFQALIEAAQRVQTAWDRTRWFRWERYSSRQNARVEMGGLVGTVAFRGPWMDFVPLIVLGEYVHAGKNATFGLGRYRWGVRRESDEKPGRLSLPMRSEANPEGESHSLCPSKKLSGIRVGRRS